MGEIGPWTRQQLVAALALGGAGAVALAASWVGSGAEESLAGQVTWLNVATTGLVVALCGGGAVLLFGHRAVGSRRRRLLADLVPATTDPAAAGGAPRPGRGWVWVAGTRRAHRTNCVLVVGKDVEAVDGDEIRRRALQRCEVCGS